MAKELARYFFVVISLLFIASCTSSKQDDNPDNEEVKISIDIPQFTKEEGVLTVLMDNSITSYFIMQGQPMGYEYEMLELFASENNLKLNIKLIDQVENILDSLTAGYGDMVAANMTVSGDRLEMVSFTKPLFRTKQVLVQRLPENRQKLTKDQIENSLIRDRLDLQGRSVMVRKNSSYEQMLQNMILETGMDVEIAYAPGSFVTEHLIDMVAAKEIDFTLCDENKAEIFRAYHDNIDVATPMSLSQSIAWAVNKESTTLLQVLNDWIDKRAGSLEFNMITKRYFEMNRRKEKLISREYDFVKEGKISDYDDIVKKYAVDLNWDWRLLMAQIYKESKFNPKTRSWRGARGLMQLMPRTAKSYGIQPNQLHDPETNIKAGTKHLVMLEELWKPVISDSVELMKFTLGSYNVGQGHVEDAMRLAEKYDLDKYKWDDNVAQMLLNKSIPKYYKDPAVKYGYCRGKEPVNYVSSILETYELYATFTQ